MKKRLEEIWERMPQRPFRFCYRVVESFLDATGLQHAASIAFFALLSILPFTLLAVSVIAKLAAELPFASDGEPVVNQVLDPLRHAIPFVGGNLQELVVGLAQTERSLGIASIAVLVFAASAGFNAVSDGINAVLNTERRRAFWATRLILAGMVMLAATALFVWQVLIDLTGLWAETLNVSAPEWVRKAHLIQIGVKAIALGVGFYFMVKVMATERYPRGYRWIGAAVFVVFFELAQQGFSIYLNQLTDYARFYGAAGAFFGLALWLYVAAIILLSSCSVIRIVYEFRTSEV